MNGRATIYTIGHSTHEMELFLDRISKHSISAVPASNTSAHAGLGSTVDTMRAT